MRGGSVTSCHAGFPVFFFELEPRPDLALCTKAPVIRSMTVGLPFVSLLRWLYVEEIVVEVTNIMMWLCHCFVLLLRPPPAHPRVFAASQLV